jgi:tripartite-type tricarboxylate transporter receptor subunit TctC
LKSIASLAVALAAAAIPLAALAQSYPDRPVRVVVGFNAGGPTDVIARIVSDKLSASLG